MGKWLAITLIAVSMTNGLFMPAGPLKTFVGWACVFGAAFITGWFSYRPKTGGRE